MGGIYPRISLTDTPDRVVGCMTLEIYGPIHVVYSSRALIDIMVYFFFGFGEIGFWTFLFLFGPDDDPTDILEIYSSIVTGPTGDSMLLETSTLIDSLYIPHQCPQ